MINNAFIKFYHVIPSILVVQNTVFGIKHKTETVYLLSYGDSESLRVKGVDILPTIHKWEVP